MISKEIVIDYISEGFRAEDFFIVDVNINSKKQIVVLVDKEKGININECINITKYLRLKFGEEIDEYELQVSSPGIGVPFKVIEQYKKNIGKQVEVLKIDGIKIIGKLIIVSNEQIEIEENIKLKSKKDNIETSNIKISFSNIKSTKEII